MAPPVPGVPLSPEQLADLEVRLGGVMSRLRQARRENRWQDVISTADEYLAHDSSSPQASTARQYRAFALDKLAPPTPSPNQGGFAQGGFGNTPPVGDTAGQGLTSNAAPVAPAPVAFAPPAEEASSGGGMPPYWMLGAGAVVLVLAGYFILKSRSGAKDNRGISAFDDAGDEPVGHSAFAAGPGGMSSFRPSGAASSLAPTYSGNLSPSQDDDDAAFMKTRAMQAPEPQSEPEPAPTPPPPAASPRDAFDALAKASSLGIADAIDAGEQVSFDPAKMKRADGGNKGRQDIHDMVTRLESDQAAMLNPGAAPDSSINLSGLDALSNLGGGAASQPASKPSPSAGSGQPSGVFNFGDTPSPPALEARGPAAATGADFTFSSLFDKQGGGAAPASPANFAGLQNLAADPTDSRPSFGALFADTGFKAGQPPAAPGGGGILGGLDLGNLGTVGSFNSPAAKPVIGQPNNDGTLSDIFTASPSPFASSTPFQEPKGQPFSAPAPAPRAPSVPEATAVAAASLLGNLDHLTEKSVGGMDLTIGSVQQAHVAPAPKAAARPGVAGGQSLDSVLFAEETISAMLPNLPGASAKPTNAPPVSAPAPSNARPAAPMVDLTVGLFEGGQAPATAPRLADQIALPEESTSFQPAGTLPVSGAARDRMSSASDATSLASMPPPRMPAAPLPVSGAAAPMAKEPAPSTASAGIDLSGLSETLLVHNQRNPKGEDTVASVPGMKTPGDTTRGGLSEEELKARQAARSKALFAEQKRKGQGAAGRGDWKEAIHYLGIASALDSHDEEVKKLLAHARKMKKGESQTTLESQ